VSGGELARILAGPPPGVLPLMGGFPDVSTFAAGEIAELTAQVLRDEAAVALQYAPVSGVPAFREYLLDRQAHLQGRRPAPEELLVTSGGMECLTLAAQVLAQPGDTVLVEGPTYLGALLALQAHGVVAEAVPMDDDGLDVDALAQRLADGPRPAMVYVIPDGQNPTGRTLAGPRRQALVDVCREHGVLLVEDVAYRELVHDGEPLPSLWSLAPDGVLQAGTFSKVFTPGVRLGWAVGPADAIARLAEAKGTSDQCASALAQLLVTAYGRGGHFGTRLPDARALYARRWHAFDAALRDAMPDGVTWTVPTAGFFTWLTLPEGLDALALRDRAVEHGVAYVPGVAFHCDDGGTRDMRLSFSQLGEQDLARAAGLLADVVREAA
jgi:2-aminoadipate transaminase